MSKEIKLISAFAPVQLPPETTKEPCSEKDIVETLIIDTYEQDAEGNIRPITVQKEVRRYDRKEYIESFSDDVGLENILKKISQGAIAEDKYSILNGTPRGQVTDLRGFENIKNLGDVEALALKAQRTFANLDPDLKKNMSFAEFVSKFDNAALTEYISGKAKKQEESAGGEK